MDRKKVFMISCAGLIALLIAFIYVTPYAGAFVENTRFEGYARSLGIRVIKESPPLPTVTSEQTPIPVIQSSYCWGKLGCADYVGGTAMLKKITPTTVHPGAEITVSFAYKPAPNKFSVKQFVEEKPVEIPLTNGSFRVPIEKGIYNYGVSAFWTSADGTYSKGDTSSVFTIEVK